MHTWANNTCYTRLDEFGDFTNHFYYGKNVSAGSPKVKIWMVFCEQIKVRPLYNILVGARDLRTLWSRLVPMHVLKIMCQKNSRSWIMWSPLCENWDPTSWKSHLKSFQVSVLETTSVKIQAPKLRSQVLKTMSWKPYFKISQAPKLSSQVLKTIS